MPSLRKVIEELEYNTLPSPTREDLGTSAAVATAATNEVAVTANRANGDTNGKQAVSPERLAFEDPEKSSNVDFGKAEKKASIEETGRKPIAKTIIQSLNKKPSHNDIVEILSDDEEEISLQDLAKLKEKRRVAKITASKTIEKVIVRPVEKYTTQVRESISDSVSSLKKTSLSAAHHVPKTAEKSRSLAAISSKLGAQEGVNSGGTCGPHAMETNMDPSVAEYLVAATPPSTQNELTASTSTADVSSIVPRTKRSYSSNPTVRKNATVVLQNIRNNLENSMPTQQKLFQTFPLGPTATMPDMERWSEYRIDSAKTIEDLESIRRRLLTLTDRVNLRLQEMRFLDAIGITENDEDFRKRDSLEDIIRSWTDHFELSSSNKTKSRENSSNTEVDSKRKRPESDCGGSGTRKRQRSSCCPFCLNTNVGPEENTYSTCSICDESSNICLHCRAYCSDCHRLTCEDCLMMCDTCFSGVCCSDCMAKTGRCASCSKVKPKANSKLSPTVRANGKLLQQVLKAQEKETPPPILQTRATDHSLHRFIITEKRALGLTINDNKITGIATIRHVQEKSIAESIGLRSNDQICLPFTNGVQPSNSYDMFIKAAKFRPLIFEVKRMTSNPQIGRVLHRFHITDEGQLGMSVKSVAIPGGCYTAIISIQPGSLGDLYGICRGDIICKPFTNGAAYIDVYSWFMEVVKQRPVTFEVWRDRSSRPTTTCQNSSHLLTKSENPFVWNLCRTKISNVNDDTHSVVTK